MKHLLVAVGSPADADGLAGAAALIAEPGSMVDAVHVEDLAVWSTGYVDEVAAAGDRSAVCEVAQRLQKYGIRARCHIDHACGCSSIGTELTRWARQCGADTIVLGARATPHLGVMVGASVGQAVLTRTTVPVLVVPERVRLPDGPLRRVLAVFRSEEDAAAAGAQILTLSSRIETAVLALPGDGKVGLRAWADGGTERGGGRDLAGRTARMLQGAGLPATVVTAGQVGDDAQAIALAAERWGAHLIVIGSRSLVDWEAILFAHPDRGRVIPNRLPVLVAATVRRQP